MFRIFFLSFFKNFLTGGFSLEWQLYVAKYTPRIWPANKSDIHSLLIEVLLHVDEGMAAVDGEKLNFFNHNIIFRSVQMRIYTLQKKHFLLTFCIFFSLFCVSVLIGIGCAQSNSIVCTNIFIYIFCYILCITQYVQLSAAYRIRISVIRISISFSINILIYLFVKT